MQPELPRTGLNGSALVELLAQMLAQTALADRPTSPPSFVEGLGRWLGWKEAIHLSASLQALPAPPSARAGAALRGHDAGTALAALAALDAEFTRVRAALEAAIVRALDEAADEVAADEPDAEPRAGASGKTFLPWRRRYFSLQQTMEAAVAALRAQARAALQRAAAQQPRLATLAALDEALAAALGSREQAQLAVIPVLLEKHHHHRRDAAAADFRQDMQRLLQAELELRLQPALGLLDALRATHTKDA